MRVLRIVMVRTLRRLSVKSERRIIQLFVSDFAGVKARHGVLPHQAEESPPGLFARTGFLFESQWLEQGSLPFRRQLYKSLPVRLFSLRIHPGQPHAKRILHVGGVRHHEINKLGDARLVRARRAVARNNRLRESFYQGILRGREELWTINGGLDLQPRIADMPAGKSPFAEPWKLRRRCSRPQNAQPLPPPNALSRHQLLRKKIVISENLSFRAQPGICCPSLC